MGSRSSMQGVAWHYVNSWELKEKDDYSIINIEYGKDVEIVKLILTKYILSYNTGKKDKFPFELITNKKYFQLIEKTNGNIKLHVKSIN